MSNVLNFKSKDPYKKEDDFLMILHWNYDEDFIEKNIESFSKILKSTLEIFLGPITLEKEIIRKIQEKETFKNSLYKCVASEKPTERQKMDIEGFIEKIEFEKGFNDKTIITTHVVIRNFGKIARG